MKKCILALGSNLGTRELYVETAIERIRNSGHTLVINTSPQIETEALLKATSPKSWSKAYINCVIEISTSLTPMQLLDFIKTLETELGRKKRPKWAPREIDIDILVYADVQISTKKLTIPHKELENRLFLKNAINAMMLKPRHTQRS